MKLGFIGTGYVGSVSGACFAEMGNTVICVDKDQKKIDQFSSGKVPLHEDDLDELVAKNLKAETLRFTTNFEEALKASDILFIAVGTPSNEDDSANLQYVFEVARSIGQTIDHPLIVVDKSTVPVGTAELVKATIIEEQKKRGVDIPFHVVSNPEFLAQGSAVKDFMEPSRIVIGADDLKVIETMRELYAPFMRRENRFFVMSLRAAETVKYMSNITLAAKVSLCNDMANLCAVLGADFDDVRRAVGADPRIGEAFMFASVGFGGSCFPKDVRALIRMGEDHGYVPEMLKQTLATNEKQKHVLGSMVIDKFGQDLSGKIFSLWGLAFKAGTDDMRESASITIVNDLVSRGAKIQAHDPEAMGMAKRPEYFGDNPNITYFESKYDALAGSDALLVVTEWKEFRSVDFDEMKKRLKQPVVFDGRLLYAPKRMKELGFEYHSIGRPFLK
jgi:UDPglucose 6-dehydrogenase